MFNAEKWKVGFLFLIFMLSFLSLLPAEQEESGAQQNQVSSNQNQPPPNWDKMLPQLQSAKAAVGRLMAERDELIRKGAGEEQVRAKSAEVMQAERDAAELFRKTFPQGPPVSPPVRQLSEAGRAELKALIEKRRQMVEAGATHKDVQSVTEQIRKIYPGQAPPPVSPQLFGQSTNVFPPKNRESVTAQNQHTQEH